MIFFLLPIKTVFCDPHLNCLKETVQMRGHDVCFYVVLTKITLSYLELCRISPISLPWAVAFYERGHYLEPTV